MSAGTRWLAAVAVAGCFLPDASGDLIFIDDFDDSNILHSSPAPGMPGGGEIGGVNFWTRYQSHADMTVADSLITNGRLYLASLHETEAFCQVVMRSAQYSEFNFFQRQIILNVRDIELDYGNPYWLEIGFTSGNHPQVPGNANAVSLYVDGGQFRLRVRENNTIPYSPVPIVPNGNLRHFTMILDSTIAAVLVEYADGTSSSGMIAHGLTESFWGDLDLSVTLRAQRTGGTDPSYGYIGEITVIPEPGTLMLMLGSMGLAVLARTARRNAP